MKKTQDQKVTNLIGGLHHLLHLQFYWCLPRPFFICNKLTLVFKKARADNYKGVLTGI